jgi:UDP-N-acetylmuramate dehydrogenase
MAEILLPPEIEKDVLLSEKTKFGYKIGGKADYYAAVRSIEEIKESLAFAKERKIPYFILGNGSNLLISDKGYRGLVICVRRMDWVAVSQNTIKAEAGASITSFVGETIQAKLSGAEELSGIPGTIGGAIMMNAGAFSQNISDYITQIYFYDCDLGAKVTISKEEAKFGYRSSIFQEKNGIILGADFEFPMKVNYGILVARQNEVLRKRKEQQPLEYSSCGSVFKRPPNSFAGRIIEQAGLKGFCVGGAQISEKHANFIINKGDATAEDVRKIIAEVRKIVKDNYNILLEPELVFLGEFDTKI